MKFALLTSLLLAAGLLSAKELPIHGDFTGSRLRAKCPKNWGKIRPNEPGTGESMVISDENSGTLAFEVKTGEKPAMFYHEPGFEVKPGEILKTTFTVSGKGKIYVGYLGYAGEKYINTTYNKCFEVNGKKQLIDMVGIRKKVSRIKASFWVLADSELVLHNIKMEIRPPFSSKK